MDPLRIDTYSTHEYQGYRLRPGKPMPFGATMVPGGAQLLDLFEPRYVVHPGAV